MVIKEFSEKVNSINERLENISNLVTREAPLLRTAAMTELTNSLKSEKQRNLLGLVRVIFLGESNAGKSTMINALAEKIVVPEVSHTSTMMPTWIGQTNNYADEGIVVNYFEIDDKGVVRDVIKEKKEAFDDFRCFYCFKPEDAADPERKEKPARFKNMELDEGYMRILATQGLMSKYSLTLVDTLGNGATIADDMKAQHNMQDVDFAFVLLGCDGTITDGSRNFLSTTLFKSRIKPEHIIFILNKFDHAQSPTKSKRNCRESILSILKIAYGNNIPEGLHEKLCSQIVPFSALYNRLVSAGNYPYCPDAKRIYNISDQDFKNPKDKEQKDIVDGAIESIEFEEELRCESDEWLLRKGHYEDLDKVLSNVIHELFTDGTIVNNHMDKPESIANGFKECIKARLEAFDADMQAIEEKIRRFENVRNRLNDLTTKFSEDTYSIISKFPEEINVYLRNEAKELRDNYRLSAMSILCSIDLSSPTKEKYNTAEALRNMTSSDMETVFVPEYNIFKEKLVHIACDLISGLIFKSKTLFLKDVDGQVGVNLAPPYNIFKDKINQSFTNYVTKYVNQIESINDNGSIKIATVDRSLFIEHIETKMNDLTLKLVKEIQINVNTVLRDSLAINLTKSIHEFGDGVRAFFSSYYDIDYFYNKLNESARFSLEAAVKEKIFNQMSSEQGFLSSKLADNIKNTLHSIVTFTTGLLSNYLLEVNTELNILKLQRDDFMRKREYYTEFVQNQINTPLSAMLEEIGEIKRLALNGEIVVD